MPIILVCPHCGKSFGRSPAGVRKRNFCSALCRDAAWSLERGKFSESRVCPICERVFDVTSKNRKQTFCSEACMNSARWGTITERLERFLPNRPVDGCWEWQGTIQKDWGYGTISVNGRRTPAHRLVYERLVGPIPDGLLLRHKCDNPPCCNPDHLEPGTNHDNIRDKVERGRAQRIQGTRQKQAKLTERDITIIRELIADGYTDQQIGAHFGVSNATINWIRHGKHWSHVP